MKREKLHSSDTMSSVASSEAGGAADEDTNEKLEYDMWEGQFSLSEGEAGGSMTNSQSSTATLTAAGTAAGTAADLMTDPKAVKNAKNQQRV